MTDVVNIMLSTFQECKESGSYFVFYLLALGLGLSVAWDRYGKTEMQDNWMVEEAKKQIQLWPFLYAILALVLVVINPVIVFVFHKITSVAGQYYKLWSLLMLLFVCAYGIVCFLSILHEKKQKLLLIGGFVILIGLAGSGYGISSDRPSEKNLKEEAKVLELVKEAGEDTVLLAVDTVLEYAGVYEPQVRLLYGKDLYTPNLDLGIMDTYSADFLNLYEAMKAPKGSMGEIANAAALYDCDVIVVEKFEEAPDKAGVYYKEKETEKYLIYSR